MKFPSEGRNINIITRCSSNYYQLGIFLLNDENGDMVKSLEVEHHFNAERIITAIIRTWIRGSGKKPISWNSLIAVLKDVGLCNLADVIQNALCH